MKKRQNNLFEIEANFSDGWSSDNQEKAQKKVSTEIKKPEKHQLYFTKEKRRGKVVTIVQPFYLEQKRLKELLKIVKKKLGTGGTLKENRLEFQGEVADNLRTQLQKLDYRFKK